MKKILFAISGLLLLAFFILISVNAQTTDTKTSKANKQINVSDKTCCNTDGKTTMNCCGGQNMNCDPEKCKEGKCDPADCKDCKCGEACSGKCGQSSNMSNCNKKCTGMIAGPMNCAKDMPVATK